LLHFSSGILVVCLRRVSTQLLHNSYVDVFHLA